ncbi:MAG: coproporphyrinogen dehydrogenase HemZ [Oscillospiraceae bacterium]|nr:coproporphyrinogen dehydrogenase HemZ [Oscillospiraceae bacterium]
MKLRLIGHDSRYALEQIMLVLFPQEKVEFTEEPFRGDGVISRLSQGKRWLTATAKITRQGRTVHGAARCRMESAAEPMRRQILRQSFYRAALQLLPEAPSWGALSGVRPTKLVSRHLMAGGTRKSADRMLRQVYDVSPKRRELCLDAAEATMAALAKQQPGDISLYVGIPFCPTRCIYCSFVASAIEKSKNLLPAYLKALEQEIYAAAEGLKQNPRRIRTVYIGGGTPTTLDAGQMAWLLDTLHEAFDLSECLEFTVEAGRPDTLDPEKLRVIRDHGATRISINPQTMEDPVLDLLGRSHSSGDILRAYSQALEAGHRDINMDLIAGLPGDSPEGFRRTLSAVLALEPTNITVHTLALKKAATLYYEERTTLPTAEMVEEMLSDAAAALREHGYRPYYLYRQKYMTGSFENVGWSRNGYDNLYNIYMMEELHSILSLGAGGMTKIIDGTKITRLANPKYPQEYLRNIGEIAAKKREVVL